jgi:hypothetical protein
LIGCSCRSGPTRLVNYSWWCYVGREQGRAIGHRDLTLAVCPVITRREGAGRFHDRTLERSCDRTHRGHVRSSVMYASVSIMSESRDAECGPDIGVRQSENFISGPLLDSTGLCVALSSVTLSSASDLTLTTRVKHFDHWR